MPKVTCFFMFEFWEKSTTWNNLIQTELKPVLITGTTGTSPVYSSHWCPTEGIAEHRMLQQSRRPLRGFNKSLTVRYDVMINTQLKTILRSKIIHLICFSLAFASCFHTNIWGIDKLISRIWLEWRKCVHLGKWGNTKEALSGGGGGEVINDPWPLRWYKAEFPFNMVPDVVSHIIMWNESSTE